MIHVVEKEAYLYISFSYFDWERENERNTIPLKNYILNLSFIDVH